MSPLQLLCLYWQNQVEICPGNIRAKNHRKYHIHHHIHHHIHLQIHPIEAEGKEKEKGVPRVPSRVLPREDPKEDGDENPEGNQKGNRDQHFLKGVYKVFISFPPQSMLNPVNALYILYFFGGGLLHKGCSHSAIGIF